MDLKGRNILVMGLGVHGGGLGVARFLAAQGARVTVTDLRGPEALAASLQALGDLPIRLVLGEHRPEDFQQAEIVVRNPGVPRESPFLAIARAAGAAVEMEMTLFFRLCPAPILAITGTKGKTTTTLLTAAMLRAQHPGTLAAGNLRVSALEQLPQLGPDTPVVLELSSFALEGLGEARLSPRYAAITNLSADHLDRYGSLAAYAEAKRQIYAWQDADGVVALNAGDTGTREFFGAPPPGRRAWFAANLANIHNDGSPAVGWRGGALLRRAGTAETLLLQESDVRLPGQHNRANVAAAAALASAFGVVPEAIRSATRSFTGVEHRLEPVREISGVSYINDTAATAPEAAIAALASFERPIVLIAGGADKRLPFDSLAEAILSRAKALILLEGSATEKLLAALEAARQAGGSQGPDQQLSLHGPYDSLERAVGHARVIAEPGDIVLLSPGCASFGMFRNEFHRGEEFRRIVGELAGA
jgi:UDP-N-acetylmuramoylalanine--D-glutamate ligase